MAVPSLDGEEPDQSSLRRLPSLRNKSEHWMTTAELEEVFAFVNSDAQGQVASDDVLALLQAESGAVGLDKRMMPVVLFVYGGGAGTLRTIDEAVGRVSETISLASGLHSSQDASDVVADRATPSSSCLSRVAPPTRSTPGRLRPRHPWRAAPRRRC